MAKTNTEKPTGKAEGKKQVVQPLKKQKAEVAKKQEKTPQTKAAPLGVPQNTELQGKEKPKTPIQKKPIMKKTEAVVVGKNVPISTKYSTSICKFIKNKKIEIAIKDLEEVLQKKKSVPMKGEYAHKKGKGKVASGGGKYPKKATEHFIRLLKSLLSNANYNEIHEPVIFEAIANIGERPYGRFGSVRKKRTHLIIKARNKKMNKEEKHGRKRRS